LKITGEIGNLADAPMLVPAIERVTNRRGRSLDTVTADRGYGQTAVDKALIDTVGVS
jgi:transposase, IS5 family